MKKTENTLNKLTASERNKIESSVKLNVAKTIKEVKSP